MAVSPSRSDRIIPILDTRKVLLEHLTAKAAPFFSSENRAQKAISQIALSLQNPQILHLLEDEKSLIEAVSQSDGYRSEKEELGEELFCKVSEIEPDLCAKITGMLLELDNRTIRQLFRSDDLLLKAVEKSKEEFLLYVEESKEKEELGETLYDLISRQHSPEISSHLTGMLLEHRVHDLRTLITDTKELQRKIELSYGAYIKFRSP